MSSDNPYQSPDQPNYSHMPPNVDVVGKVKPPAIALIVVGVINLLLSGWGVISSCLIMAGVIDVEAQQAEAVRQWQEAGMDQDTIDMLQGIFAAQGPMNLALNALALVCAIVIIMGGLKMMKLKSYGMSMTSSILAMIPCLSSCCLIGLPIGIWALIVLNNLDVKNAFSSSVADTFSAT